MSPFAVCRRRWLALAASLALSPATWAARRSASTTLPLLLAQDAPADVDPSGFLVSEKYDGVRAWWDGASLRTRSGGAIAAPAWFTAALPPVTLDGELWLGRGRFEALSGAVRRHRPDDAEWRALRYMVFELPGAGGDFAARARQLAALARAAPSPVWAAVEQVVVADRAALRHRLDAVVAAGGEGLVLHRADAPVLAGRSAALLKLKPVADAEAVVVGHTPGQGRHAGRIGALRVRMADGTGFLIGTGLSDELRDHPPPVGTVVTFTYRGRTETGVPRFASFLRLHPA